MTRIPPVSIAAAAVLASLGGANGSASAQTTEPPARLFVLGDSLSDMGNAAALADYLLGQPMHPEATVGLCHPVEWFVVDRDCADIIHGRSRVSNGPVGVEHLATHLGAEPFEPSFHTVPDRPVVGTNYAVAGAKARGSTPRDLAHQVDRLTLDHGLRLADDAVAVVMIGGNDAIDALQAAALPDLDDPSDALPDPVGPPDLDPLPGIQPPDPSPIVADAVDGIVAAATRLLDAGACVIVANAPNLGALPAVREAADENGLDGAGAIAIAEQVTTGFNADLHEQLMALAAAHPQGTSLVLFDLHGHFDAVREAAELAGVNVTDACFDSERYIDSMFGERVFHPDCAPAPGSAPAFDEFLFWDGIHPTGATHAVLGAALIEAYEAGCREG